MAAGISNHLFDLASIAVELPSAAVEIAFDDLALRLESKAGFPPACPWQ
jgi:hypothetical protein